MKTLLNVIWFVFSGFWLFLGYLLAAVIMFVLIITIPGGSPRRGSAWSYLPGTDRGPTATR